MKSSPPDEISIKKYGVKAFDISLLGDYHFGKPTQAWRPVIHGGAVTTLHAYQTYVAGSSFFGGAYTARDALPYKPFDIFQIQLGCGAEYAVPESYGRITFEGGVRQPISKWHKRGIHSSRISQIEYFVQVGLIWRITKNHDDTFFNSCP